MRICLVTPELPPHRFGGIGQYVTDLAAEYSHLGHEVVVLGVGIHPHARLAQSWGTSVSLPDKYDSEIPGRIANRLSLWVSKKPVVWRIGHKIQERTVAARADFAARALAAYLSKYEKEFHIIEVPNWLGHGAHLRPRTSRLVVRLSSPATECGSFARKITRLEAQSCHNADLVIGNSDSVLNKARQLYDLKTRSCIVIPHGVADKPPEHAVRRTDGLDLLYVGRCEPRKGTDILIQALPQLFAQNPTLSVTFLGFEVSSIERVFPHLTKPWNSICREYGTRIRCLGMLPDSEKLAIFAKSHWVLIPSRYESFGLVAIESIRAGTPFVAAASGGLTEIAAAVPECLALETNDVSSWQRMLATMAEGGVTMAESRREACRRHFVERFTARRMAENSLAAYHELLPAPRSATLAISS